MPISDTAFGQIVRRHFQGHAVAGQHSNAVAAQLARQVGENGAVLIKLDAK